MSTWKRAPARVGNIPMTSRKLLATPKTYQEAKELLGDDISKKLGTNVYLFMGYKESIGVMFYETPIVMLHPDGTYTLQDGGYYNKTTKEMIENFTPFTLTAHKNEWYVTPKGIWPVLTKKGLADVAKFRSGIRLDKEAKEAKSND